MPATVLAFAPGHRHGLPTAPEVDKVRRPLKTKQSAKATVCLDYLKGKCVREQCRYPHPDLTLYRKLSGLAGEQVCEVWATTGQCKFGAKCNRLHPVFGPPDSPNPTLAADPVPEYSDRKQTESLPGPDSELEFQDFARSLLKSVDEAEWQSYTTELPAGKSLEEEPQGLQSLLTSRRFPTTFRFDSIFLDILKDLHLVSF